MVTKFYIIGSNPVTEVKQLEELAGVRVTGFVDDIRQYHATADVCVVPLWIARGIQNKVLEAMAMGKPVVSTTPALEGIKAVRGQDIIEANTEEAFAAAVIDMLKNRRKAEVIGKNARLCVERHYSWEKNLRILNEIILPGPKRVQTEHGAMVQSYL